MKVNKDNLHMPSIAKNVKQPRSMQAQDLSTRQEQYQGSFKMHEISTQSIIQTSALFHNSSAFHSSNNIERTVLREEVVVSPEPDSDDDTKSMDVYEDEDSEKDDVEVSMINDIAFSKNFPPTTLIDNFVSSECSIQVSSPLGEPKEVRFRDIPPLSDDDEGNDFVKKGLEELNEQEKESFVLHEQLRNVLADLSAEKAMRLKKEKSLIKLAKEIKKRNEDTELHERKLVQMATLINNLHIELQQQQERHLNQVNFLKDEKEHQVRILEETIEKLRAELQVAQSEMQRLCHPEKDVMASNSVETKSPGKITRTQFFGLLSLCFPIIFIIVVVAPNFAPSSILEVRNVLCAPLRPGTKLLPHPTKMQETYYEAPWWVPYSMKPITHSIVCHGVPRSHVQWKGDKLLIRDADDKILLHGRGPAGVQFDGGNVHLFRTNRGGIDLPAPWDIRE